MDSFVRDVSVSAGGLWAALRAHATPSTEPCARCGSGYAIRPSCVAACIVPVRSDACPRCAQPLNAGGCRSLGCRLGFSPIRRTDAVLGYKRGDVERLVLAAKHVERWAITALGRVLAGWLLETAVPRSYDMVVPVPFHRTSLGDRPAHPLTAIYLDARPAVRAQLPLDDLRPPFLVRLRPRAGRRTGSERARWLAVRGTVALGYPTRLLRRARVLVVDDVMTSGATLGECARVILEDGGAASVDVVVLTRQPWRLPG